MFLGACITHLLSPIPWHLGARSSCWYIIMLESSSLRCSSLVLQLRAVMLLSLFLTWLLGAVRCADAASVVTWDPYSLLINGERVFIQSGEFHYERLPVPALWRDVLEKYKANGLNAVSV